jgi:hypothetical protein
MPPSRVIFIENKGDLFKERSALQQESSLGCIIHLDQIPHDFRRSCRDRFLKSYIDLVGQISRCNDSLLWWCTDLSSKNRFLSPLAKPLEILFLIKEHLALSNEDTIIFVHVPGILKGTLRTMVEGQKIQWEWHGGRSLPLLSKVKAWLRRIVRIKRHALRSIIRIMIWRTHKIFSCPTAPAVSKPQALILSFISPKQFNEQGHYKDMFFGPLVNDLEKSYKVCVLADITGSFGQTLDIIRKQAPGKIYPLEAFLKLRDILFSSWQLFTYNVCLDQDFYFEGTEVSGLLRELCVQGGDRIQPAHYYRYWVLKRYLTQNKPGLLLYTCEFNPWEKMCLQAVKEISPGTRTIGYQHAVIPQASVNMFTSRYEEDLIPKPDLIVTVGDKPKEIIQKYTTSVDLKVVPGCGLRFDYMKEGSKASRSRRGHVLVVLEGVPEIVPMLDYLLTQWKDCDDRKLKIRPHPMYLMDKFAHHLSVDYSSMANVEISQGIPLKDDLQWADAVIYWGSTTALEALMAGKPVIHFDTGSLLSYDPLFELDHFKWIVTAQDSIAETLSVIERLSDEEYIQQCDKAQAYIRSYIKPVTDQAIQIFYSR